MAFPMAEEKSLALLIAALLLLRLVLAAIVPLSVDEAYYWQWTHPLQLSYYDHPAMVAWWIRAATALFGDAPLAVRLPAVLASAATTVVVWKSAALVAGTRRAGAVAAFWLNAGILFTASGLLITPDAPLLLFWSLALWAALRLIAGGGPGNLYLAAAALGLGALSKYTMVLVLPGLLAPFLLFADLRRWWRTPHPYLAGLLGLLLTTPLLAWNLANGFASFGKQLNHAFGESPTGGPANAATFLAGQAGLVTPLIFGFALAAMVWSLIAGWRRRRADWLLLGGVSLPILLFFLFHTLSGPVQAHWGGPAYLGGIIAAAALPPAAGRRWRGLYAAAPWLGLVMTLTVLLQAATAILPIPPKLDALKRLGGWPELAAAVAAERQAHPGSFLLTPKHEVTGILAYYLPDHPPVFLQGPMRPSTYSAAEVAALKGRDAIFVTRARYDGSGDIAAYFAQVTRLRQVDLLWRGQVADAYVLYLAQDYRGGALVQGDGLNGARDRP
ncbi:MAG TPA: glycosyl transferase [Rhodospirillaceae bacterium]|nr:glycosyl transferase [Rhodospirillaceae bacterium]